MSPCYVCDDRRRQTTLFGKVWLCAYHAPKSAYTYTPPPEEPTLDLLITPASVKVGRIDAFSPDDLALDTGEECDFCDHSTEEHDLHGCVDCSCTAIY